MKRLLPLLLIALSAAGLSARRISTGPGRLAVEADTPVPADTLRPDSAQLRLSGYDKPNSATRETFFATNCHPDSVRISRLRLTFSYFDMSGRQLHEETRTVDCDIPPGATRRLSVPSWDRNNAFHYFRSPAPVRRQSTPYRVASRIDYAIAAPSNE